MKTKFFAFIILSSLLALVTSCSDHSKSTLATSKDEVLSDNQIINILMTVDKQEIAASEEALKKQVSPPVQQYANYIIHQHQRSLEAIAQLANQLKVDPKDSPISKSMISQGDKALKNLDGLDGQKFDKAYIDEMVKGHQEGLKLIETKLYPAIKNPQLKMFVEQFHDMVADHLEKALRVQQTL